MRTKGAKTNKECWSLKIYYDNSNVFVNDYIIITQGTFKTLYDVANFLNISYNQVTELTSSGRNKTKNKTKR